MENEALKKELEAVRRENDMLKREMGAGKGEKLAADSLTLK